MPEGGGLGEREKPCDGARPQGATVQPIAPAA